MTIIGTSSRHLGDSNGNTCQSIKENELPEGCSHCLLRLTGPRKQEIERKHGLMFLFKNENEG